MESVQIAMQQRLSLMPTRNSFIAEDSATSSHASWRVCIIHDDHRWSTGFWNKKLPSSTSHCHYSGNCWSYSDHQEMEPLIAVSLELCIPRCPLCFGSYKHLASLAQPQRPPCLNEKYTHRIESNLIPGVYPIHRRGRLFLSVPWQTAWCWGGHPFFGPRPSWTSKGMAVSSLHVMGLSRKLQFFIPQQGCSW